MNNVTLGESQIFNEGYDAGWKARTKEIERMKKEWETEKQNLILKAIAFINDDTRKYLDVEDVKKQFKLYMEE